MTEEIVKRARISLEIGREASKCCKRLIEIDHLLKIPEYSYKNELRREKCELLERVDELIRKLLRW
ncbi:MAG: hypothetical protein LBC75_00745 [Fibromonadaceae bacterium]|jgi:hypothetical protein|nr:hypothetical protein [Fibromonadaceae bacterium]